MYTYTVHRHGRRRMDHYSSDDRAALARAVAQLLGHCGCHFNPAFRGRGPPQRPPGCNPGPDAIRLCLPDGTTYCAFEPGSGLEVDSRGQVRHYRSVLTDRLGHRTPLQRAAAVNAAPVRQSSQLGTSPMAAGAKAPKAPLPAAFRVCRVIGDHPRSVKFGVPARAGGRIVARTGWKGMGELPAGTMEFPRRDFESSLPPSPKDIERDLGPTIEAYEDGMCLGRLQELGAVDDEYVYRWNSALDGLAAFVEGLNASRPRALRLDRVIVNCGMYLTLFGNDRRTDSWAIGYPFYDGRLLYRNMSVLDGIAFLHHPGVPHDGAYALSSAQGPVFAHGPSRIDCTDGEIAVSRHCGIVDPPRGLPECPWGVRFGARKDRDADNEWPEDSE